MRIAICDDEKIMRNHIKKLCQDYSIARNVQIEIIEFCSGEEFLAYKEPVDVLLLDIQMGEIDGIKLKKYLEYERRKVIIIFISSFVNMMQEAFGEYVYSFLNKPVQKEKLYEVLDYIIENNQEQAILELEHNKAYVKRQDVIYIEAQDKYTRVVTLNAVTFSSKTMGYWEELLNAHGFMRVHKTYIVNFSYIKRFDKCLIMDNGEQVELSRRKTKAFIEQYSEYIKRKAL